MKKTKKRLKTEIVFHLIKKMSQSDKRYFKLANQSYNRNKDFLKLFDYLNAQQVLNFTELGKSFEGKNINSAISYLHDKIVEILEEKAKKSLSGIQIYDESIEQHLRACHVYLYTELLEHALGEIHKAEEVALKKEDYGYLIRIYRINKKMLNSTHLNHYDYVKLQREISTKLKWALGQYQLINEITGLLNIIIYGLDVTLSSYQEAIQEIESYAKRMDELPHTAKRLVMRAKMQHYYRKKEYKKTISTLEEMTLSWESIPYEQWNLNVYIAEWNNLLFLSASEDVPDSQTDYFKKYLELPEKHPAIFKLSTDTFQKSYDITKYSTEVMIILLRREYDKIYEVERNFSKAMPDLLHLPKLTNLVQAIFLSIVLIHLILKNYERFDYWSKQYHVFSEPNSPWNSTSEILDIMMHYDKKNFIYLKSRIRNLSRKWQKEEHQGANMKLLLKLIQKVLLKSSQNKISEIWKAGLNELYEAEKIRASYYIELSRWVEAKIESA